jgi:hypothetical protein
MGSKKNRSYQARSHGQIQPDPFVLRTASRMTAALTILFMVCVLHDMR